MDVLSEESAVLFNPNGIPRVATFPWPVGGALRLHLLRVVSLLASSTGVRKLFDLGHNCPKIERVKVLHKG